MLSFLKNINNKINLLNRQTTKSRLINRPYKGQFSKRTISQIVPTSVNPGNIKEDLYNYLINFNTKEKNVNFNFSWKNLEPTSYSPVKNFIVSKNFTELPDENDSTKKLIMQEVIINISLVDNINSENIKDKNKLIIKCLSFFDFAKFDINVNSLKFKENEDLDYRLYNIDLAVLFYVNYIIPLQGFNDTTDIAVIHEDLELYLKNIFIDYLPHESISTDQKNSENLQHNKTLKEYQNYGHLIFNQNIDNHILLNKMLDYLSIVITQKTDSEFRKEKFNIIKPIFSESSFVTDLKTQAKLVKENAKFQEELKVLFIDKIANFFETNKLSIFKSNVINSIEFPNLFSYKLHLGDDKYLSIKNFSHLLTLFNIKDDEIKLKQIDSDIKELNLFSLKQFSIVKLNEKANDYVAEVFKKLGKDLLDTQITDELDLRESFVIDDLKTTSIENLKNINNKLMDVLFLDLKNKLINYELSEKFLNKIHEEILTEIIKEKQKNRNFREKYDFNNAFNDFKISNIPIQTLKDVIEDKIIGLIIENKDNFKELWKKQFNEDDLNLDLFIQNDKQNLKKIINIDSKNLINLLELLKIEEHYGILYTSQFSKDTIPTPAKSLLKYIFYEGQINLLNHILSENKKDERLAITRDKKLKNILNSLLLNELLIQLHSACDLYTKKINLSQPNLFKNNLNAEFIDFLKTFIKLEGIRLEYHKIIDLFENSQDNDNSLFDFTLDNDSIAKTKLQELKKNDIYNIVNKETITKIQEVLSVFENNILFQQYDKEEKIISNFKFFDDLTESEFKIIGNLVFFNNNNENYITNRENIVSWMLNSLNNDDMNYKYNNLCDISYSNGFIKNNIRYINWNFKLFSEINKINLFKKNYDVNSLVDSFLNNAEKIFKEEDNQESIDLIKNYKDSKLFNFNFLNIDPNSNNLFNNVFKLNQKVDVYNDILKIRSLNQLLIDLYQINNKDNIISYEQNIYVNYIIARILNRMEKEDNNLAEQFTQLMLEVHETNEKLINSSKQFLILSSNKLSNIPSNNNNLENQYIVNQLNNENIVDFTRYNSKYILDTLKENIDKNSTHENSKKIINRFKYNLSTFEYDKLEIQQKNEFLNIFMNSLFSTEVFKFTKNNDILCNMINHSIFSLLSLPEKHTINSVIVNDFSKHFDELLNGFYNITTDQNKKYLSTYDYSNKKSMNYELQHMANMLIFNLKHNNKGLFEIMLPIETLGSWTYILDPNKDITEKTRTKNTKNNRLEIIKQIVQKAKDTQTDDDPKIVECKPKLGSKTKNNRLELIKQIINREKDTQTDDEPKIIVDKPKLGSKTKNNRLEFIRQIIQKAKGTQTEDEPKIGDAKQDEPKIGDAKQDEPKIVETQQDEPKIVETQQDEPKIVETQQDEPKIVETQQDETNSDEVKQDEPKSGDTQQDESKSDEVKQDEPKSGDTQQDESKIGEDKTKKF